MELSPNSTDTGPLPDSRLRDPANANPPGLTLLSPGLSPAHLDLLWHLAAYAYFLGTYSRRTTPNYARRLRKASNLPLLGHLAAGLVGVFRYHARALRGGGPVRPDLLDLGVCAAHAYGTFALAKDMLKGHRTLTRPTFQMGGVVELALGAAAYALGSAVLHRAAVKFLDGYVYVRLVTGVLMALGLGFNASFAVGNGVGALWAMTTTGLPGGELAVLGVGAAIVKIHRWTSARIYESNARAYYENPLVRALTDVGFVEIEALRLVSKAAALSPEIDTRIGVERKEQ
ncbi:hypothetical protein F4780DRAFT_798318 [Xylariomycetidae sp. FL0641]|nr:hypothetical protein F4780DRAFT_798318 [Xylariomycetidae sp. FL0641]